MIDDTARLVAIRAREEAATLGPWAVGPPAYHRGTSGANCKQPVYRVGGKVIATTHCGQVRVWNPKWRAGTPSHPSTMPMYLDAPKDDPDAVFIAAAREDIPWLLSKLEAVLARLREN